MIIKRNVLLILAFFISLGLIGKERGFAIVVDLDTYAASKVEIDQYKTTLLNEGYAVEIFANEWHNPQEVKDVIYKKYKNEGLEGAIFIGEIPIPMIRDAQHLTSAFKMNQENFPFQQSSVPSDRFYDDFDLTFTYLSQDEENPLFHYYSLNADSPQYIKSDIYTSRLKPTKEGNEGYQQIKSYFVKLLDERKKDNALDVITSYTGEGSFSNSMTAWRDQTYILKEHFPDAFKSKNSVKSLLFSMYPYMKDLVVNELRRDEMDLMLFHEHGVPHRQYLTATPYSSGASEYSDAAKRAFRRTLLRENDTAERDLMMQKWMNYYNIDSTWFDDAFSRENAVKDSLEDLRTGIILEDVPLIAPNARVVIFDACYNGDFREDQYIAGEYLFADGKTLVTLGNSVNVLQDKSSTDMIGMLGLGFNVGEWARETNILESHIFGDPTFRFSGSKASEIDLNSTNIAYWLNVYENEDHPDLKGLALHRLSQLNYKNMPQFLTKVYEESPWYTVRLQVFHLLQQYDGDYFAEFLKEAIYDPFEFIRRKSIYSMGKIGSDEFIPYLAEVYLNDYLDERVHFNVSFTFDMIDLDKFEKELKNQLDANNSYYDKESLWNDFKSKIDSRRGIVARVANMTEGDQSLKTKLSSARTLRNINYHKNVDEYLKVVADENEDESLRVLLAEAIGWFTHSYQRDKIVDSFTQLASMPQTSNNLREELNKSIARIKLYMR